MAPISPCTPALVVPGHGALVDAVRSAVATSWLELSRHEGSQAFTTLTWSQKHPDAVSVALPDGETFAITHPCDAPVDEAPASTYPCDWEWPLMDMNASKGLGTGCASSTRGLLAGGRTPTNLNIIDFITISTLGNAADFGDLTQARLNPGAGSNSVRGVFAGGESPSKVNTIDYVTIPTLGDAVDFGNLTSTRNTRGMASPTRAAFAGGNTGSVVDTIDYVQIMSTADAIDFGDLNFVSHSGMSCSNGHGGL